MSIPSFQSFMLPVLKALADKDEWKFSDLVDRVADDQNLSPADKKIRNPKSKQSKIYCNVSFALLDLCVAGFAMRPGLGFCSITEAGKNLLGNQPARIDRAFLKDNSAAFAEKMEELKKRRKDRTHSQLKTDENEEDERVEMEILEEQSTPEERLDEAYQESLSALESSILSLLRVERPEFLERVIVDLLVAIYAEGDPSRGEVTRRSGDSGIDGVILEDAIGLNKVYFQAKRFKDESKVGPNHVREFAGSLGGEPGSTKGIFVTTATFSSSAQQWVEKCDKRIILINGKELASLMVEHDIGVRVDSEYTIKRIDRGYFE